MALHRFMAHAFIPGHMGDLRACQKCGESPEIHEPAPPPEPVLARAEAERRLTDAAIDAAWYAMLSEHDESGSACGVAPMRQVIMAALFPEGGQG